MFGGFDASKYWGLALSIAIHPDSKINFVCLVIGSKSTHECQQRIRIVVVLIAESHCSASLRSFDHSLHCAGHSCELFFSLAERVSLTKTPCWSRVQTLERERASKGYHAIVDPYSVGLKLTAFVEVPSVFSSRLAFERVVEAHPAIIECYTTAGEADYLLPIMTSDVERLDSLLREELCRLPGAAVLLDRATT